jgi:hypothetical protein
MGQSFLPRKDAALLSWAQNFIAVVQPVVATYGLEAADLTAFSTLTDAYQAALAACEPVNRSKTSVIGKNQARTNLRVAAKNLSDRVQGTPTVSNEMKSAAGLNVKAAPVDVPVPGFAPSVKTKSVVGRLVTLAISDAQVDKRRKPPGCKGASWFSFAGPTPPDNVSEWKWEGTSNKRIVQVLFDESVAPGTKVWVTAVWLNTKNQPGPACDPVGTYTQFGGMSEAM